MPGMGSSGTLDELLMDVVRRIQLPASKHEIAERQYRALTDYIDREGSPLEGKVEEAYPSGSFSIHSAIASRVRSEQYDVDIVVELNVHPDTAPERVIELTFQAINGHQGSRYYGKVEKNSRCVTVHYDDGVSIDVMPVARLPEPIQRAANLFHYKRETGEQYHKPVNPFGFATHFNRVVSPGLRESEAYRRHRGGGLIIEAEAQPLPVAIPFEDKPLRVLALQLLKRHRIVAYRRRPASTRQPPSVVQAALSLKAGPPTTTLTDELVLIAQAIRDAIMEAESLGQRLKVYNPAFPDRDLFTDRWPENRDAQRLYSDDLRRLIVAVKDLANREFDAAEAKEALESLFGESATAYALDEHFARQQRQRASGRLGVAPRGRVGIVGATFSTGAVTSVRANTNMGGRLEDI